MRALPQKGRWQEVLLGGGDTMLFGLVAPGTHPLGARVGLSMLHLSQLESFPFPAKADDFKRGKGHMEPPRVVRGSWRAWLGVASFLPLSLLCWLLVAERETKLTGTKLDCLWFRCYHLVPPLGIHTSSFSPCHSLINRIFVFLISPHLGNKVW